MPQKQAISVVVPTLNEVENIPVLLARIDASMVASSTPYEVIVVDDNSSDNTVQITESLTTTYPVRSIVKKGKRGKAYSLMEGFAEANYDLIAMIDADLQYPPEAIAPMYDLMQETQVDMVVTRRKEKKVSPLRKLSTKVFNLIFTKLLFGIDFDTQSGLKLFDKKILRRFTMKPSPWSFDLEFIVRALENKFKIASHDIAFDEREFGATKVKLLSTTFELAKASLQLRWRTSASKIRAGYRANSVFMKQAFRVLAVTAVLAVGSLAVPAQKTDALSLGNTLNNVLSPVTNLLGGGSGNSNASTKPSNSGSGTTNTTTPTTPTPAQQTSSTATTPVANSATSTNAATPSVSSAKGDSSVQSQTAATKAVPDSSNLSPATAQSKKTDIYASGYPYYTLSSKTTSTIANIVQTSLIAGALCAAAAILILTVRSMRAGTHKLLARR